MLVTSAPAASALPDPSASPTRRVAWASMVGTSLESFDFYVFAYFAAFFVGPLFFDPLGDVRRRRSRAFSTIALAFIVRPIGAILFGHMGDRLGRRTTLLWTVGIMGIATGASASCRRTRRPAGSAPILLVLLRIAQGLSLGGEWGGSILLATEHSGPVKRAFYAAIPQLGSPVGSILSAALFIVMTVALPAEEIAAWGWRIPFLLAIPLLAVSLYLRWSITETPVFEEVVAEDRRDRIPFLTMFRSASRRDRHRDRRRAARHRLVLADEHLHDQLRRRAARLQLPGPPRSRRRSAGCCSSSRSRCSARGRPGSARRGSSRGARSGTLLIAFPMYFLLQFATFPILVGDDDHRRHPADDVVGGARRAHERPVPRPLPLLGAVDLVRDRRDGERLRAGSSRSRSAVRPTSRGGTPASCSRSSRRSRSSRPGRRHGGRPSPSRRSELARRRREPARVA